MTAKRDILVVGSLAYDSVQTPFGKVDRALGGSANYFSLAASLSTKVRVVGVVGEDYSMQDMSMLEQRGVDLSGIQIQKGGKTFHWAGSYSGDMNEAKTHATELNVFESFDPVLPAAYQNSQIVFLANIMPELQLKVLSQVKNPAVVGMDTMNLWIQIKKEELLKVLSKVQVLLINEGEAKLLTGGNNAVDAAPKVVELGPKVVVIKRGEYGFLMFTKERGFFSLPAFPVQKVIDPTGAGDSFAGGFFGSLSGEENPLSDQALRRACVRGCLMASFTIQDFSVNALSKVQAADLDARALSYQNVIQPG